MSERSDVERWWMFTEYICEYCGDPFISRNEKAKHCSRSCALKHRGCSITTRQKLSDCAKKQWEDARPALLGALATRDMSGVSESSKKLWQDERFRDKIQSARRAVGYPDPNRPEQILKRKVRMAAKNALHRSLRHLQLPKTDHTYVLLGYTGIELKECLEKQFIGGMSWINYGEWEIDHIYPIASFPLGTDIKVINALPNLRPLWKTENRKKWKHYVKL